MAGDRRVKLVFAAELGRRLLRTRGFSRCWFLLPARARLVGDVAHAIRAEFGLEGSASVELRLEQLLLLPTHDARILRDHDELLVQSVHAPLPIESDVDEERKAKKLRKQQRKEAKRQQQQQQKSDDRRVRTAASRKRSVSSAVSDSDSSSSSSDLEIEEVVTAKEKKQKEKSSRPTHKRQRLDPGATTTVSAPVTAQKSAGGSTEPKQRRRRRQRNRKPREASASGAKELGAPPSTPSAPPAAADSEQQLSVAHEDLRPAATKGHRAFVSPELQKYGPSASTASSSEQQQQQQQPSNAQLQHRQHPQQHQQPARIPNSSDVAPDHHTSAKKAKVKYGTMWKRPYEIVATILDASSNSTVPAVPRKDVSDLLTKFPAPTNASVSADAFQGGDVVAYKTLTLCMETWQPVASEWLCGKVQSVDADQVTLLSMALSANEDGSDSLQWTSTERLGQHPDAVVGVQIGEVSDVRYLDGPSYQKLHVSNQ